MIGRCSVQRDFISVEKSSWQTAFTAIALFTSVLGVGATSASAQTTRPVIGVAFGGGSARGIAHIGVIQWFEENHIPIDTAAGTSMGGLIGGAFAIGMDAAELRVLVNEIDWDTMFGGSSFPFKNVRRKEDARSYPSRLEFGMRRGIVPPPSLNDGQQVDLLLARLTGPYFALQRFDDLPTPFRVVAVDLRAGEKVVLESGSLATALRATMSLPAVFPPVERDGRVLVDGGALDNVPADVVRNAGANVVIAIDVGTAPPTEVDYSLFGLLGQTADAMMRSSTRAALAAADLTIAVDVAGFGSLDWRRANELIDRGYQAAERKRDELLKHRVSDADWQAWLAARASRRKTVLPQPTFLATEGIVPADVAVVERTLQKHLNLPIDVAALDRDLATLSGLDRYQSVTWQVVEDAGRMGLMVRARAKVYGPPYLMLGLNIENTTSETFRVRLAARYLAFDVAGSGSELRIDGSAGADPNISAALYQPLGGTPLFVRTVAGAQKYTFGVVDEETVIAQYRERRLTAGGALGVNLSRVSEVTAGVAFAHLDDDVVAGDPGLPELSGAEIKFRLFWLHDGQDSPVIPSRGTRAAVTFSQTLKSPEIPDFPRTNRDLTQFQLGVSSFYSLSRRNRIFGVLAGGTSFDDKPLPTEQFTVGYPYLLDAFGIGERRGDHYGVLTAGFARQIGRLPDFLGGPVFGSLWLQNGATFNSHEPVDFSSQIGTGIVVDTLLGPVLAGVSVGLDDGRWRTNFGIGRIFR
jgi:NTE family protein